MNNYYGIDSYGDYLEHHGRLGQRKGVQNGPPYPLDRQTVTSAYGSGAKKFASNLLSKVKKKSTGGSSGSSSSSSKKEEPHEETPEERKARIIKETNIKEAWEHKDEFTTKEIEALVKRFNSEEKLKKLVDEKRSSAFKKGVEFLRNANSVTETVLKTYENYGKLKKIFTPKTDADKAKEAEKEKEKEKKVNKAVKNIQVGIEAYKQFKDLLPPAEDLKRIASSSGGGGKKKKKKK